MVGSLCGPTTLPRTRYPRVLALSNAAEPAGSARRTTSVAYGSGPGLRGSRGDFRPARIVVLRYGRLLIRNPWVVACFWRVGSETALIQLALGARGGATV